MFFNHSTIPVILAWSSGAVCHYCRVWIFPYRSTTNLYLHMCTREGCDNKSVKTLEYQVWSNQKKYLTSSQIVKEAQVHISLLVFLKDLKRDVLLCKTIRDTRGLFCAFMPILLIVSESILNYYSNFCEELFQKLIRYLKRLVWSFL